MKSSCIRHPESTRFIQLHEWQVRFCRNNHCAALLLSYFTAWHDWKLRNDHYYRRSNDIAEMHGDGRPHNQNAYLFFSTEELIEGCMVLYGKKAIADGLELLASLNVISIHKNPNPRYHFDKTKYFQFYPHVCNRWIAENYPIDMDIEENHSQVVDYSDRTKMADRRSENALPSSENGRPSRENRQAITNTTNNTTNKNKPTKASDDFFDEIEVPPNTEQMIHLLTEKGMPVDRLQARDDLMLLANLVERGATATIVSQAYDQAIRATSARGKQFGMRYLAKVIEELLETKRGKGLEREYVYENDLTNAMSWAADLI